MASVELYNNIGIMYHLGKYKFHVSSFPFQILVTVTTNKSMHIVTLTMNLLTEMPRLSYAEVPLIFNMYKFQLLQCNKRNIFKYSEYEFD